MSNNINVHQDANDNSTSSTEKKFELLVVGAGIAGLSFVYGLRRSELYREGKVGYKIVERRDGPGTDLGYPIHLSSAARKSLESMFSPPDLEKLHHARSKIPVYHDGITVSSYRGKKAWRTVREPGTRPMIEREELMEILRGGVGVGEVEYGLEVVSHSQKEGGVEVKLKGREGRREEVKVDLVVDESYIE
ncbi:hypothetical protein I302_101078 [Kwoniella bestiolae CBS 10118]|uniref:FAD dependent oxidoreductase domain-containing protein n=1 Tax=Kwoniella bestiolae CBS 10118 TaxID=1296100 RepID=A0A1B9G6W0_9TREE|nr:hypothetical protein I302_04454 [Kwoniella bestiolae CBS 10118]OCF26765.1 hypothetical protein I302_04454 [Kwoniella bestiolae CBS 10118]